MRPELSILLALCLPLFGGVLTGLFGKRPNLRDAVTLIVATALIYAIYSLLPSVIEGERPMLYLFDILPGLAIHFKVEPLGMLFACVASLLWLINSIYSIAYMRAGNEKNQTRFYICFTIAIASTMGIAFSANLLTLFIFYETLTLSTYPLVTHKGSAEAVRAGRRYLGLLLGTSICFFLPAIIFTQTLTGTMTFAVGGVFPDDIGGALLAALTLFFVYGVGKAALFPVHQWLPSAMVAPTPVSALLHAVAVVKAGVFCIVKIVTHILGSGLLVAALDVNFLLYLSGFTIVFASLVALRSDNLKRRLAYSTISQLSYVILATALLVPISIMGAALHILAHAFGKITLFFAAGAIYVSEKKTNVSQLDGVGRRMPITMTAFTIGSLSMIGVPPTAGFLSKWYILQGAFAAQSWFAAGIIVVSTLLNAAYFLPIVYAAFFGRSRDEVQQGYNEAPLLMVIALSFTALMTLLLFLFPGPPLLLLSQLIEVLP